MIVVRADEGRRVTINPLVACGTCRDCSRGRDNLCPNRQIISMPPREGAFAEYVAMPETNLVTVPGRVPLAHAALAEPLACGWHAVRLGAFLRQPLRRNRSCTGHRRRRHWPGSALSLAAQGVSDITLLEPNAARRSFLVERCAQKAVSPDDWRLTSSSI